MLEAIKGPQGRVLKVQKEDGAVLLDTDRGQIKIQPYSENIVRVRFANQKDFSTQDKPGITAEPEPVKWSLTEEEKVLRLKTQRIELLINRETSAFSWFDGEGRLLVREPERGGKTLIPYRAYKTIRDENTLVEKIDTPDGVKEVVLSARKEFLKNLNHSRLELEWSDGEALYGLGQQEEGVLNLRGTRQYIHQANMKIANPFLVSTRGYGILVDTYSPLIFNDNEFGSYLYSESSEEMDFYFVQGETLDEVVGGYRSLSGRAAMLPKWAYGYIQSKERYEDQVDILATAREYRRRNVPLDCIVLDWQSWEEGMWGQKSFDKSRFPDTAKMMDDLHDEGVHFMISLWPNMHPDTDNYKEMKEKGTLCPYSEIYNAFSKEARELYWNQVNKGLFGSGIDSWWCDASEPVSPEWTNPFRQEPDADYHNFHDSARNYMDEEYTNAYPLMHAMTMYEGQRGVTEEKRVTNLTRSGYTGQQRYGAILWSGDISANWETLRNQIPAGLNLCASGLPYWTLDIGAFFVKKGHMWFWNGDYEKGNQDLGYRELYTRWLQLGTFLPVFRSHGTDTAREIWNFGEEGEIFYDTIRKFIKLRYTLMPYIYSISAMVTLEHYTVLRLLAFDFPGDEKVFNIRDQFMFGSSMMVCPVTEPMYFEADSKPLEGVEKSRNVYLPEGSDWYDFWTGEVYRGGQLIKAETPLETMPVFIKSGSILPMTEVAQHTGASSDSSIELHIYPGADASFTLYQDEKDNYNYERGEYGTIGIIWNDRERTLTLDDRNGSYAGMEEEITFSIVIKGEAKGELLYKNRKLIQSFS